MRKGSIERLWSDICARLNLRKTNLPRIAPAWYNQEYAQDAKQVAMACMHCGETITHMSLARQRLGQMDAQMASLSN